MADPQLKEKVEELIAGNPVLLFMKGTPEMPRCGFSMRVVQVLDTMDVEHGGADIVAEMFESGELAEALGVEQPEVAPQAAAPAQSPPLQIE